MSILSDSAILSAIGKGDIVIAPFNPENLGSNSYDVTLAGTLAVYKNVYTGSERDKDSGMLIPRQPSIDYIFLDAKKENELDYFDIPEQGIILYPNILYLAVTNEYTESPIYHPRFEGLSSVARLGISVHQTAGYGDVGYCGHWTLEISVVHPVKIYRDMPIGQIDFNTVEGEVLKPYNKKPTAKYNNEQVFKPMPMGSGMWKKFKKGE